MHANCETTERIRLKKTKLPEEAGGKPLEVTYGFPVHYPSDWSLKVIQKALGDHGDANGVRYRLAVPGEAAVLIYGIPMPQNDGLASHFRKKALTPAITERRINGRHLIILNTEVAWFEKQKLLHDTIVEKLPSSPDRLERISKKFAASSDAPILIFPDEIARSNANAGRSGARSGSGGNPSPSNVRIDLGPLPEPGTADLARPNPLFNRSIGPDYLPLDGE